MNDQEKEKWMDEVFHSMKGSQRARPRPEVFAKIQAKINASEAKVITLREWRYAVATAILVLIVNVFALHRFNQNAELQNVIMVTEVDTENYGHSIISNFNIYE